MENLTLVSIEHLSVYLGGKQVLCDVNLYLESGDVFGFLGPNGAGKTTTMKIILGLLGRYEGKVSLFSDSINNPRVRERIGFMPENTYLYKYLTGREFLKFNGRFFAITGKRLTNKVEHLLEMVGLAHAADDPLHTYSKGMLQRIGLAQALINNPEIVFLDEPMSGLDPLGRKLVKDIILDLKERGVTVFFNTHILSDVASLCNKFAIIHQGKIIANTHTSTLSIPLEQYFIDTINVASTTSSPIL